LSTIVDVARLAGVSTATVSRVINSPDQVKAETREIVLQAMETCRYQYNALARGFVTKKSKIIGLVVPSITNAIFAESTTGVQDITAEHGYQVILGNSDYEPEKEQRLIKAFREMQVEGLIITTTNPANRDLKSLSDEGFPFVLLYSTLRRGPISCIGVDNVFGGSMAVSHLIDLGHRRIGMLAGSFSISDKSKHRWLGYRNVLKKNNIPYDPDLVIQLPYRLKSGNIGIKSLMALNDPPTAVFCSNDYMAMGAIEGARELGLDLPTDLSLVGYDDNPFSSFLTPRLSTIRQPAYEMGAMGAQELFHRIESPDRKPVQKLLNIALIERDSTAGPRGQTRFTYIDI
jgi:DNA-binding LacI/PurR family transcriptional regulator